MADDKRTSGAGVLPFSIKDDQILLLLHQTLSGKKIGTLIDFGGASNENETPLQSATREFTEGTLFCKTRDHL